jgi:predicted AlkP superfamily pyrophosphatase or phosphodiesterase
MRNKYLLIVFLFLSPFSFGQHVILISIDGFRPEMYRDAKWPAPNLRYLLKQGVYADHMKSVFPAYTYPSHTAMLTGALPARSGITHNVKDDKGNWYWFTADIKTPTLWQALKQNNLTSSAVEWPVSVSNDITYNIPEIWNNKHPEDRITETRNYATKGLIEEIEKNATGSLDSTNMNEEYFSLDDNSSRMAAYIFKTYQPNLLAVHFALLDGMEHAYGKTHDSVTLALAAIDRCIGNIIETVERSGLKDKTAIIIVGDHGFSNIHTVLRPNMLLKDINAKFKSSGGSALLYGDANAIEAVKQKLNGLPKDQKKLFSIIDRNELDKMGADSAALLAISGVPGIVFSGAVPSHAGPGTTIVQTNKNEFTTATTGGHHGYDPNIKEMYTGFIAAGAGINKGASINELCVTDIAPLIARLLNIPFSCPDGKLINGILKQAQ